MQRMSIKLSATCSTILTELRGPLDVIFDVLVAHGWSDSAQSGHEVIHSHWWAHQLCWVHGHQSHVLTLRVGWERRNESTFWCRLESLRGLASSHWHHQRLVHDNGDIRARVALGSVSKFNPLFVSDGVLRLATLVLHDTCTGRCVRETDVDSLLETSSHGLIEFPRHVSGTKNENTVHVVTNTLHLNQELSFDSSGRVVLTLTTLTAEGIDFINEDDGWLAFTRHVEELLDETLRLTHPLGDKI